MNINSVTIPNEVITAFSINFFGKNILNVSINLGESFQKRADLNTLTTETAIKILKNIKLKSDILSCLTKPVVLIPLSLTVMTVGFIFSAFSVNSFALSFLGILFSAVGGGMTGLSLKFTFTDLLPLVSKAYRKQCQLAEQLIKELEANPNAKIIVA